jgi:hypothetical protein
MHEKDDAFGLGRVTDAFFPEEELDLAFRRPMLLAGDYLRRRIHCHVIHALTLAANEPRFGAARLIEKFR